MATVSKTKSSALAKLEALESEHQQAADKANALAGEHSNKMRRLHGWLDEPGLLAGLNRLRHRDPQQFDSHGSPRGPEAKRIQAEIDAVGDPQALIPELEQARRLEEKARRDLDALVAVHLDSILDELRSEGETVAAVANSAALEFVAALDGYLAFCKRAIGLVAAARGHTRRIQGLDAAADLLQTLELVELPSPLGEEA